jgi:hypothetical protein
MRRQTVTPEAGGKVDPTQIGRALARVGIELIPVYSPKPAAARSGCSQTLQDGLPKELRLAGITSMDAANRFLADDYLPRHDAFLPRPPEDAGSAFAPFAGPHEDILCVPEEQLVGNMERKNRVLQIGLPPASAQPHRDGTRVRSPRGRRQVPCRTTNLRDRSRR